jgi:hypothetical protein
VQPVLRQGSTTDNRLLLFVLLPVHLFFFPACP